MIGTPVSTIEMEEWQCCICGVVSWMPKELDDNFRKNYDAFFCVNGHGQTYLPEKLTPPTRTFLHKLFKKFP